MRAWLPIPGLSRSGYIVANPLFHPEDAMALGGSYTKASSALIGAMVRWRDKND